MSVAVIFGLVVFLVIAATLIFAAAKIINHAFEQAITNIHLDRQVEDTWEEDTWAP